ncbi:MAG: PAS domain S-box protein [Lachnospiraceae bacterium]|nr:PAS domain S-box protein [Lachnospiraceae bacterium]
MTELPFDNFLRSIQQLQGNAVLMRELDNGDMEVVHVSEDFASMMECTVEEAKRLMDGKGFLESTNPDERLSVRRMLRRHESDEGGTTLTIQKTTAKGRSIWCNVHYAFIDDYGEHFVYCTYFDVTVHKEYEERLRSVYTSMGKEFYDMDSSTLGLMRVNLTRDSVEDIKGRDLYHTDRIGMPFTASMRQRLQYYPIDTERAQFEQVFDRDTLIAGFAQGRVSASQVLYSKRQDGSMCYVNVSASITRHPLTGDIIAFITEKEYNVDKVRETLIRKILAQQFDMVSYVAEGEYGVVVGDPSRITEGSIFPLTRYGNYSEYLENQVYPVLSGSDEYKQSIRDALDLSHIRKQIRISDPYSVNIAIEMDGQIYYKRFDFFLVDPKAHFSIVLKSDTTELQREQIRRNEQLAEALEEAKQANIAKTAFLSSM